MTKIHALFRKVFLHLISPFISKTPAAEFLKTLARNQWRLIGLNIGFGIIQAFTEGATLGVIFLAVQGISANPQESTIGLANSISQLWPNGAIWINSLENKDIFLILLLLAVFLQGLQSLFKYLSLVSAGYFAARCRPLVMARIHKQALSLDFASASNYRVGTLTDFAVQGEAGISLQIDHYSTLLVHLLMIITYIIVIIKLSPWLLLAALLVVGLLTSIQRLLIPSLRSSSFDVSNSDTEVSSTITEHFQGLRLLHTTGQLEMAENDLKRKLVTLEKSLKGQTRIISVLPSLSNFLSIIAIVLMMLCSVFIFGGSDVGVLPNLVTFILALQRLNVRLGSCFTLIDSIGSNSGRMNKLNQILSRDDKSFRRKGGLEFKRLSEKVIFKSVTLSYSNETSASLNNISFDLYKGKMLALVGPSGAGKSSIVDLLVGLYSPSKGNIFIDDVPLNKINLNSWQEKLGVVSQDTFLFNCSIAENVGFGCPDLTIREIKEACKAAQAIDFIERLPDGFDTLIGERGYRLSGGQRQRLSLARAIIKDPELLILDEATSSLDSTSENLVEEAIRKFQVNRTILTIAHRLSTIVRADTIIVLDRGKIIEMGDHKTLIANQNLYYQLWKSQQTDLNTNNGIE